MDFKLPDLGEGITEGEVLKWLVKEGDQIKEDQPIVEVMTDKVNVQVPSPRSGKVSRILVKEGDVAKVGQTILVIDDGSGGAPLATLVAPPEKAPAKGAAEVQQAPQSSVSSVLATPATRKLARELGVDITKVHGSGPQGRVTDDDIKSASRPALKAVAIQEPRLAGGVQKEEVVPLRGLRRTISDRMVKSLRTTAQVTHVDEADVTELVLLREALKGSAEKRGVRLTYLPFIIKALVPALKEFPYVNSSLDEQAGNIVLKKYYNIGVATDTEQGLVVPVVKDVDRKDIFELAGEITKLSEKARTGQLSLDDVRGATFTITNVGAIGGLFATPIINLPEVAILGLHKIAKRPVIHDGKIEVRDTTFLSLSFDHRVMDGAYAARFTSRLIETIQDTKKLLAEVL
ncbi:MAG: 2-oxo acid dehydrogenase subunit E2 [Nitrososphaerota archaeon]|jgi:pyruvate dehydrogenase E2 component (dihydrolipoamide acetyltransferase)|nr:2-oxo acid dehydrogenase subunit E2 [Nitrososphaerota archaeon]MDG6918060.1 2-oxo acid dehydrogenase subunit E2 [Nitrososphaerota archaeon]MDG6949769.1 2-oxo acid dehydrogenase subunit E2 [Nitrososphaerota archaeon]